MKRAKGENKPNIASIYPINMGSATVIPLNDEGRAYLVELMYPRRITWDRNHPDFSRPDERKQAWEEIRDELLTAGLIQTKVAIVKVKNTISMLKSCYRNKKKEGTFDRHAQNCMWLQKMDSFMSDATHTLPYAFHKKILSPGGSCSVEDNLKILNFYKEHELLWNPQHPDYQDRALHVEVWAKCEAVVNKKELTSAVCKKVSKSLRQRYINRRRTMSVSEAMQYGQHMEWFRVANSFLGPLLFPISKEPPPVDVSNLSVFGEDLPTFEEMEAIPRKLRHMPKEEKYVIYARFMRLYQKMPILWDLSHPHYHSKEMRRKSWLVYTQQINIRYIRPNQCREKVKRIKAAYMVRRRQLSDQELELAFLQPEWFSICESIYAGKMRNSNIVISDEEDDLLPKKKRAMEDDSEDEVEKLLDLQRKNKTEYTPFNDPMRKGDTLAPVGRPSGKQHVQLLDEMDFTLTHWPEELLMGVPKNKEEIRVRVISAFKHQEMLWNNKHRHYGSLSRRLVAHQSIVDAVNVREITDDDIKTIIRDTKKSYTQMRKQPNTPKPLWFLILDSFLGERSSLPERRGRKRLPAEVHELRKELKAIGMASRSKSKGTTKRKKKKHKHSRREHDEEEEDDMELDDMRHDSSASVEDMIIKTEYDIGEDIFPEPGPEFVATEVIDLIKKEEDDTIIQSKPAPPQADNCRACLQEFYGRGDQLKCLKNTSVDGVPFINIYNEVIGSSYHDSDGHLPEAICNTCFQAVVEFNRFHKKCLANEKQYLTNKQVHLLEKSKAKPLKRQAASESDGDRDAGPSFQDDNGNDSEDSYTWEDDLPLNRLSKDVKPRTSERTRAKRIKLEQSVPQRKRQRRPKNIKKYIITENTKREYKEPDALSDSSSSSSTPLPPAPPPAPTNFDVGDFDLDSFFDNNGVAGGPDNDANKQPVVAAAPATATAIPEPTVASTEAPPDIGDAPRIVGDLEKHSGVIRQVTTDWMPRKRKVKPPEIQAKEESQFANYLKDMLAVAKNNPAKGQKDPNEELQEQPAPAESGPKRYYYDKKMCPECGITTTNSNYIRHMKLHQPPENLFCQTPNCHRKKPFLNELQLHQHMLRVHRNHYFNNRCDYCQINFTSRKERSAHMKAVHPSYRCDICHRNYKTHHLMLIHRNAVHVMERNEDGSALQCDVCHKEFKNYTLMNQHRRRIHFAKQHPCKQCEFSASSKYQLKKHMTTKHPPEDAEQYTCHLCEKKFSHLHFLKNHFLTRHSTAKKFVCKFCPRVFRQERSLGAHYEECHPDDEISD